MNIQKQDIILLKWNLFLKRGFIKNIQFDCEAQVTSLEPYKANIHPPAKF